MMRKDKDMGKNDAHKSEGGFGKGKGKKALLQRVIVNNSMDPLTEKSQLAGSREK